MSTSRTKVPGLDIVWLSKRLSRLPASERAAFWKLHAAIESLGIATKFETRVNDHQDRGGTSISREYVFVYCDIHTDYRHCRIEVKFYSATGEAYENSQELRPCAFQSMYKTPNSERIPDGCSLHRLTEDNLALAVRCSARAARSRHLQAFQWDREHEIKTAISEATDTPFQTSLNRTTKGQNRITPQSPHGGATKSTNAALKRTEQIGTYKLQPTTAKPPSKPNQPILTTQRTDTNQTVVVPSSPTPPPAPKGTTVDHRLASPPTPQATDFAEVRPDRVETITYRILRDTELARSIKAAHHWTCQICGQTIKLPDGSRYAEAHHIRPLGEPHNGPDTPGNIICVCPNHHAELDYRARALTISTLRIVPGHSIDAHCADYHNHLLINRKDKSSGL